MCLYYTKEESLDSLYGQMYSSVKNFYEKPNLFFGIKVNYLLWSTLFHDGFCRGNRKKSTNSRDVGK